MSLPAYSAFHNELVDIAAIIRVCVLLPIYVDEPQPAVRCNRTIVVTVHSQKDAVNRLCFANARHQQAQRFRSESSADAFRRHDDQREPDQPAMLIPMFELEEAHVTVVVLDDQRQRVRIFNPVPYPLASVFDG